MRRGSFKLISHLVQVLSTRLMSLGFSLLRPDSVIRFSAWHSRQLVLPDVAMMNVLEKFVYLVSNLKFNYEHQAYSAHISLDCPTSEALEIFSKIAENWLWITEMECDMHKVMNWQFLRPNKILAIEIAIIKHDQLKYRSWLLLCLILCCCQRSWYTWCESNETKIRRWRSLELRQRWLYHKRKVRRTMRNV